MPIDRTLFDLWVDEPLGGPGDTGTRIHKALIASDILDPIDDAIAAAGGTPAGSDTHVQFNDAGAFAGDAGLTYNKTTDRLTTALLTLTGGQIAFPATQNASADANTLDDYEEGTWTPTLGGNGGTSGQTYTIRTGAYVKCGQIVVCPFAVELSAKGTITGNVEIQGLPFTVSSAASPTGGGTIFGRFGSLTTSVVGLFGNPASGGTASTVNLMTAAATGTTAMVTGDLSNTTLMYGVCFYRTAA
jgi:hypothetical protein